MLGKETTANMLHGRTDTRQLTIRWRRLPTFLSFLSYALYAERQNKRQGDKDRDNETGDYKESTPPTAQAGTIMSMYRKNVIKYPGYMAKLSMVRQRVK